MSATKTRPKPAPTAAEIEDWLVRRLAEILAVAEMDVEVTIPFARYGLDSVAAVGLAGELQDWLGVDLDPTLLYDYPTVGAVARYLAAGDRP